MICLLIRQRVIYLWLRVNSVRIYSIKQENCMCIIIFSHFTYSIIIIIRKVTIIVPSLYIVHLSVIIFNFWPSFN